MSHATLGYIPLADVPHLIPRRRRGRKLHVATAWRWATAGCRGIILRTVKIGNQRCTRREWLDEFFSALAAPRQTPPAADRHARVERALDEIGI